MSATKENITLANIFDHDTVLHLRIPFSFYLLPVFCFGISQAPVIHWANTTIVFIALHLFIYPGSNSYNSYMDKDTGSIGGLESPPPVTRKLYYASIIFDTAGLLLCALSGWQNVALMAGYIAFSKAYSWQGIRLKKYAWLSWCSVMVFQGGYTFLLANAAAMNHFGIDLFSAKNMECMLFASIIIGGSYPLTQVYQHGEDSRRGDFTISYRLGIKGTFMLSAACFTAGILIALHYFTSYYSASQFIIFLCCIIPVAVYFSWWFFQTSRDTRYADYNHAMLMNKISSTCMTLCFIIILIIDHTR